ncbi:hypothetical protein Rs2_49180 [Raphanus sativus]|nr:hypothetical protein Rs2_51795 [Raphanus sativus]KAJ4869271.1 hypothetical protein Rs2_49180 [Raphanus sativus]
MLTRRQDFSAMQCDPVEFSTSPLISGTKLKSSKCETAFEGAQVVFHMAAPDSSINSYQLHYSVNVQGKRNVIDACVEVGVKRLIYTSSPSVVFDGVNSVLNASEIMPYPSKQLKLKGKL